MSEQICIDIYGQIEGENDNYRIKPPERVDIDAPALGDGYTYERFYAECPCAIHRTHTVTAGGRMTVQKEVAYDDWNNRVSASFIPINSSPILVYRQEIYYEGGSQTFTAVKGSSSDVVLSGGSLRYGTDAAEYLSSSYCSNQAQITSGGTMTMNFETAGTYNFTAYLIAPMAKPVPVSITITVTNS